MDGSWALFWFVPGGLAIAGGAALFAGIAFGFCAAVEWRRGRRRRATLLAIATGVACVAVIRSGQAWWRREFSLPADVNCAALERLMIKDAPLQAAADARRGASHLVGVQGYTIALPGVPEERGDWLPSNYRVQVLPCTSDAILSRRHEILNEKARAYALAYNRATLAIRGAPRPQYRAEPVH